MLILLLHFLAFANEKRPAGIELCSEVHSFLKKSGFSPVSQSLVISGENTFPYNIIVTFNQEQNTSPENLLIIFFQEDVPENQDLIKEALRQIKEAAYPFTTSVLFASGEKQKLEKADMIYGTQVFLESLNTNLSYTAVIFDLESKKNEVISSANGLSSPPLLIKNAMNLYRSNGIGNPLPAIVLSQLSSYSFISSSILSRFFDYEIPAIKLSLGGIEPAEKEATAVNIITNFVKLFSKSSDNSWEGHFMLVRLFGSYHIISEGLILRIVTPVIFIWILFIFMLIFVNRRLKRHTWYTIGKIWWSVPLTYLIITFTFFISGLYFRNMFPNISDAGKIYGQFILQISFSLFIILSVYLLLLTFINGFDERAVDYLLVISCFINQSIFILADISLSPIFIIICLLSLLALTVKNNYLHIAVFLLMILPLIPYGHRMVSAGDLHGFALFMSDSKAARFVIPFVLYPVYIVLFRIITSVRTKKQKIRYVAAATISAFFLITITLTITGLVRTRALNKREISQNEIKLSPLGDQLIDLSVSDKNVFDDIIRTVDVELKEDCILCDILITTEGPNPILYSDNDYTNPSANTARFRIPENPPKDMTFRYGAAKTPCRITVSAVIEGENEGDFSFISRSLEIGEE